MPTFTPGRNEETSVTREFRRRCNGPGGSSSGIEKWRVFEPERGPKATIPLAVAEGYRAMDERRAIMTLLRV
jgi:hypothetical protein